VIGPDGRRAIVDDSSDESTIDDEEQQARTPTRQSYVTPPSTRVKELGTQEDGTMVKDRSESGRDSEEALMDWGNLDMEKDSQSQPGAKRRMVFEGVIVKNKRRDVGSLEVGTTAESLNDT
jgi:hypothetical protein